jgi:hypothetical protein
MKRTQTNIHDVTKQTNEHYILHIVLHAWLCPSNAVLYVSKEDEKSEVDM